jgi:hypothetical protein
MAAEPSATSFRLDESDASNTVLRLVATPSRTYTGRETEIPMRAEVQNVVEEIKQSVGLLRRSL